MPLYKLYLRIGEDWKLFRTIDAAHHKLALREAIACLGSENYDKQLRLEQAESDMAREDERGNAVKDEGASNSAAIVESLRSI